MTGDDSFVFDPPPILGHHTYHSHNETLDTVVSMAATKILIATNPFNNDMHVDVDTEEPVVTELLWEDANGKRMHHSSR